MVRFDVYGRNSYRKVMKIRVRCKALDFFKVTDRVEIYHKSFDFLSMGYSRFYTTHFLSIDILGFQVGIEWGYVEE